MARKKPKADTRGKRRTREHVIADMSVLHVEDLVVRSGFTMQRVMADYGYDATITTYNEAGEPENEEIHAQIKASDDLNYYSMTKEQVFSFPVRIQHYRLWARSLLPVLLILYDAQIREAYALDVREYALTHIPKPRGKTINVHVPRDNVLGASTLFLLRERAQQLYRHYRAHQQRISDDER